MALNEITEVFRAQAARAGSIGKTLKFVFEEGVVHIDLTGEHPVVSNDDKEADCTITTKVETLDQIRKGEINPMMAVMTGKVKIKGDMSVAMKLQSLLG